MKVLHIGTERSWRGGENQILLLIDGLNKAGISNFLAYPSNSRAVEKLTGRFPIVKLNSSNPLNIISILRLVNFCRKEKIDILDAHSAKAHQLGLILKTLLPHLKLVVHRRVDNVPNPSWWTKKRYLSQKVDRFVAISQKIKEILIEYGVPAERIEVARSAIDLGKYENLQLDSAKTSLCQRLGLSSDQFLLGNASALTEQKGYEVLISALARLKDEPGWTALIAGEGHLEASLKSQAQRLGLSDRIKFIGFIDYVPEFLAGLDLLCVPSNNEGLGTLILDGIAAHTPVIATRVGGIPEIIIPEKTGLLVEKGDDAALASAIARLKKNPHLGPQYVEAGLEHLKAQFSLENMVQKNRSTYESL